MLEILFAWIDSDPIRFTVVITIIYVFITALLNLLAIKLKWV